MCHAGITARGYTEAVRFVNPRVTFNGDRVEFVDAYVAKNKEKGTEGVKTCTGCGASKPVSRLSKDGSHKDGVALVVPGLPTKRQEGQERGAHERSMSPGGGEWDRMRRAADAAAGGRKKRPRNTDSSLGKTS